MKKMNPLKLMIINLLIILPISCHKEKNEHLTVNNKYNNYDEKPAPVRQKISYALEHNFSPKNLNTKELEIYNKEQEDLNKKNYTFSSKSKIFEYQKNIASNITASPQSNIYNYADNTLRGKWHQHNLQLFDDSGFRAIGSAYDPVNDEIYVVSHPGHFYKINENNSVKWSLRNNKKSFAKAASLNGVNLQNGSFRLLFQKGSGGMEFSDDEGRTWIDANGAYFQNNWNFETVVTKKETGRRVVAHGGMYVDNVGYHRIYISTDYGINYTTSLSTDHLKISEFDVKIVKPHNSRKVFCFARRKSDNKVYMYKMEESNNDFIYIGQKVNVAGLNAVFASEINNIVHFYISSKETHIYYSSNNGNTWSLKTNDNDDLSSQSDVLIEMHPTLPNVCFKNFTQSQISYDYGVTWSNNSHKIGPSDSYYVYDLQHFKTYDKENGGNLTFSGYDFGSFYTTNSTDWSSWNSINRGNPTMLSYDAATSKVLNKIYSANQDRGTQSFIADNGNNDDYISSATGEASTDNLRVTVGNNDGVWIWYYYGSIGRTSLTNGGGNNAVIKKSLYPKWAATSIIPSPDTSEDAVYIPWGNQLNKISNVNNSLVNTNHPYVFSEPADCFGYSKLNTNRWYAGLRSGPFMYSTDGGTTFTQSSYSGIWPKSIHGYHKSRAVIAASPIYQATVYYAGEGNTFLISNDGGASFTKHANGFTAARIIDLAVSANGKYIFAACANDGAWVYSVDLNQWYKMDGDALPNVRFTSVQYIDNKETVRFGTFGSGIIDFNITNSAGSTLSNGLYTIELEGSGKCISVEGGDDANGTPLRQWTCENYISQRFRVEKQSDGTYEIRGANNDKSITINFQPANGSYTYIWDDLDQANQRFYIQSLGNENYRITPSDATGKALAIRANKLNEQNAYVIPWNFYNTNNFRWKFKPVVFSKNENKKSSFIDIKDDDLSNKLNKSFKVYPNPASNNFKISFNNFEKVNVIISDVIGKVIYKTSTNEDNLEISKKDGFKSGIYLIKVTDVNGKVFNDKLIIN